MIKFLKHTAITLITVLASLVCMFIMASLTINDFSILNYDLIKTLIFTSVLMVLYLSILTNLIYK